MMRLGLITLGVVVLGTTTVPRLAAQGVEIAARIGYVAPTGTQFRLTNTATFSSSAVRAWDGGGISSGVAGSYWFNPRVGIQGTADLHFVRHYATYDYSCTLCTPTNGIVPGPVDVNATQLVVSLRLAARQVLGDRLQLGASVGPAVIRFGDAEYRAAPATPDVGFTTTVYDLADRATVGVAFGLSAALVLSQRFRLSVSADDFLFRARPAEASSGAAWSSIVSPMQHAFTLSALVAVTIP